MDLMGDLGNADQLTSAREENKVLKAKVDELKFKVKELTLENATLLAEVEMYRKEAALPSFSKLAIGGADVAMKDEGDKNANTEFIASGNGVYPSDPVVTLPNLHGSLNPLCCALNSTDSVLATGGADGIISLTTWGTALAPTENAAENTVSKACRVSCSAPVICVSFCKTDDIVAVGCMDGSVHFVKFNLIGGGGLSAQKLEVNNGKDVKHTKYVKFIDWSPSNSIIASASADGTVQLSKISLTGHSDDAMNDDDDEASNELSVEKVQSLHLKGAVESGCFLDNGDTLCLYERETSYLSYFDLKDECKLTQHCLNGSITGGFDEHVSFAVMHLCPSPNGRYLCAATDSSRNIIIEAGTPNIVRDLYGHKNDGFSQPKVAWSSNSQYVFGNTQEDSSVCVWDIASASIVKRMGEQSCNGHKGQLRDVFSSKTSDTLVTASYDKTVKIWLNEM